MALSVFQVGDNNNDNNNDNNDNDNRMRYSSIWIFIQFHSIHSIHSIHNSFNSFNSLCTTYVIGTSTSKGMEGMGHNKHRIWISMLFNGLSIVLSQ